MSTTTLASVHSVSRNHSVRLLCRGRADDVQPGSLAGVLQVVLPVGLCVDPDGNVYVADSGRYRIVELAADDLSHPATRAVAGGSCGLVDGALGEAKFMSPMYLAYDGSDNCILVTDQHCVRRVALPDGHVTTLAGGKPEGFQDGPADVARFHNLRGIALDRGGNAFVADSSNHCIRKISAPDGQVTCLAGSGTAGFRDGRGRTARFSNPCGVAVMDDGSVVVADSGNNRIRLIDRSGVVSTLAGDGIAGYRDGQGTTARFNHPQGIAVDGDNNVLVCDLDNHRIRMVSSLGLVSTIAGGGGAGKLPTTTAAAAAISSTNAATGGGNEHLHDPTGIAINNHGAVIFTSPTSNTVHIMRSAGLAPPRDTRRISGQTSLQAELKDVLLSGQYADVSFRVEDQVIPAHKLMLMIRCDYFRTMFSSSMAESLTGTVTVDDVGPDTFRTFLLYLYTDELKLRDENVLELMYMARKYLVPKLQVQCSTYMRSNISTANAVEWFVWADEQHFDELRQAALDYIAENLATIRTEHHESMRLLEGRSHLLLEILSTANLNTK